MSETRAIYNELRQPLLRSGALLAVLLLVIASAGWFNAHMDHTRQTVAQDFQGAVQDYRAAIASEQILRTDAERFAALRARGFIGPEPRLQWIEDVRETAEQIGVIRIRYELEPRRAQPAALATGSYQLFASAMKLQLELHHEGDLLTFLDQLDKRHSGLFDLTACTLRRSGGSQEPGAQQSNLSADCELLWYSLDTASAAIEEEPS